MAPRLSSNCTQQRITSASSSALVATSATFGQVKGNAGDGRSRLATLKVAINVHTVSFCMMLQTMPPFFLVSTAPRATRDRFLDVLGIAREQEALSAKEADQRGHFSFRQHSRTPLVVCSCFFVNPERRTVKFSKAKLSSLSAFVTRQSNPLHSLHLFLRQSRTKNGKVVESCRKPNSCHCQNTPRVSSRLTEPVHTVEHLHRLQLFPSSILGEER